MQVRNLISAMCFQCIDELKMQMNGKGIKQLGLTNGDVLGFLNLDFDEVIVQGQSWAKETRICRALFCYKGDLVAFAPSHWDDAISIETKPEIDEKFVTKLENEGYEKDIVWLGLSENYDETDIFGVYDAAECVLREKK